MIHPKAEAMDIFKLYRIKVNDFSNVYEMREGI